MNLRLRDEERQVLGALFVGALPLDDLAEVLRPEDFATDAHTALWADVLRWHGEDRALTPDVILSRAMQQADRYGGAVYVSGLGDAAAPTTFGVAGLARQIRKASDKRRVSQAYREALDSIAQGEDIETAHAVVERAIDGATIAAKTVDHSWVEALRRSARDVLDRHEAVAAGAIITLPMPMPRFAERFVMEAGELVILGARPGMGKSSLAMQVVECCEEAGFPTCTFMLEMTELQTIARLGSTRSPRALSPRDTTQGRLSRDDLSAFVDAAAGMAHWRGELCDSPGLTVEQLGRRARAMKRRCPELALIVVDHIGKLGKSDPRMSDYEKIGHATAYLKNLAKELEVVVFALCQLNRKVEERFDKRPKISDLRDSGKVEEDADSILFLYRGDYYEEPNAEAGIAEVIVAKQRQGESNIDHKMRWDAQRFRFSEIERPWAVYGRDA
jgi:replicative DNA helicase